MKTFAPSEHKMWETKKVKKNRNATAYEIDAKYAEGGHRIVTESNRERLPSFVASLKRPGYMELRPFYQRRPRWDRIRQSRLIESFIINVPVPPIFLYEKNYNSYEVVDGQQRITAIQEFYDNRFALKGLELWPELNGMKYSALPPKVRAGIDRRSISSIVLLKESAPSDEEAFLLRQLVFERLNTGGVGLAKQEIRNALYPGPFNNLLLELSRLEAFRRAWHLPLYSTAEDNAELSSGIFEKSFFKKMEDLEVILRFFALRHVEHYRIGMKEFLDLYMVRSLKFAEEDIAFLRDLYVQTIHFATEIYGERIFQPYRRQFKQKVVSTIGS